MSITEEAQYSRHSFKGAKVHTGATTTSGGTGPEKGGAHVKDDEAARQLSWPGKADKKHS